MTRPGNQKSDQPAEDELIRRVRALRDDSDPRSVTELLRLCTPENSDRVRDEAADHLWMKIAGGVLRDPGDSSASLLKVLTQHEDQLIALLDDDQSSVRMSGIKILAEMPTRNAEARARIAALASGDPDAEVRELAGQSLHRLEVDP